MKRIASRFNLTKINSVTVQNRNGSAVLLHIVAENELGELFEETEWYDEKFGILLNGHHKPTEKMIMQLIGMDARKKERNDSIS